MRALYTIIKTNNLKCIILSKHTHTFLNSFN